MVAWFASPSDFQGASLLCHGDRRLGDSKLLYAVMVSQKNCCISTFYGPDARSTDSTHMSQNVENFKISVRKDTFCHFVEFYVNTYLP